MVLRGATSLFGALEGVSPENLDFFDVTIAPPAHEHPCLDYSGRGRPANHPPPPEYLLTQDSCKETSPTLLHTTTLHNCTRVHKTTNVPVVFMARYVMILRGATSLRGALDSTFLGPNGTRFARAISGPKKVSIFRAHPFQCPS
jgi:hypothetical protein